MRFAFLPSSISFHICFLSYRCISFFHHSTPYHDTKCASYLYDETHVFHSSFSVAAISNNNSENCPDKRVAVVCTSS